MSSYFTPTPNLPPEVLVRQIAAAFDAAQADVNRSIGSSLTRSTTGTYYDANGYVATAAINQGRMTYNPANLTALPTLLVEAAATNLVLQSAAFDNASWTKTRSSASADLVVSPDNTKNADRITEDTTATNTHLVTQSVTLVNTTAYVASVFLKAAERTLCDVIVNRGATNAGVLVNLAVGTITTPQTGTTTDLSSTSTITKVANGFYRVTIPFTSDGTGGALTITLSNGSTVTYTGDGSSGLYAWGAQLERGTAATSYIPTTSAAVTRGADITVVQGGGACAANVAPAPGGITGLGYMMSNTANLGVFFGSGAPTLTAAQGSLYLNTTGSSTSTRLYVNTDGATTWTAVTTVA